MANRPRCSYNGYMRTAGAVTVGVRELKNRLTTYLRLAREQHEVIVTERGKPIAILQSLDEAPALKSIEARIAALAARGEISAPEKRIASRMRRVKVAGRPLSQTIVADRR
ncbi:MAG TPA: type II toxin-antitoxin system Phd/YefM family antitoxin [Candidatus Binataceae bacterium]|nr:type II toxin-antitoxin system Phd/YefM family antitoxin [Candidatus Binataceae bacterium]